MAIDDQVLRVLRLYDDDCQPSAAIPHAPGAGFSGASIWRLQTERGPLCLRRWPREHPSPERLEFIQAVLWHVDQEGFREIPLPLETQHHHGYVRHGGYLWELVPWLPGEANFDTAPSEIKLKGALEALAQFHTAARSFPLPESGPVPSPGLAARAARIRELLSGGQERLRGALDKGWPELVEPAKQALALFAELGPQLSPIVDAACRLQVPLAPCIRDIWSAHVLYVGQEVSGIVDFGAMRPENVAGDVARLLGSMAGDNSQSWQLGLASYEKVHRLSADELALVQVFDRTAVLLSPLQWLEWIFVEERPFPARETIVDRFQALLARLRNLADTLGREDGLPRFE